jgi:hypothetical protein
MFKNYLNFMANNSCKIYAYSRSKEGMSEVTIQQ